MIRRMLLLVTAACVASILFCGCPLNDFESDPNLEVFDSKLGVFSSEGGALELKDGTIITIPPGILTQSVELTFSKLNPENQFSKKSYLFDLRLSSEPGLLQIDFKLPEGLNEDDISMYIFNPDVVSNSLEGSPLDFNYNAETGVASVLLYGLKSTALNPRATTHKQIVIERATINASAKSSQYILLPYYTQPSGACFATCAAMVYKAYSPYNDRRTEWETTDFLNSLKIGKNEGMSFYTFRNNFRSIMETITSKKAIAWSYFSSNALLSDVIEILDKKKPIILFLDYPGLPQATKTHAIVLIGYEKISGKDAEPQYNIIYHDPSMNSKMNSVNTWDYLMSLKGLFRAYHILFVDKECHKEFTLQSIGMPIGYDHDGSVSFKVEGDMAHKKGYFFLDYNEGAKVVSWLFRNNQQFYPAIPDTAVQLEMLLPIWNMDAKSEADVTMKTFVVKKGSSNNLYIKEDLVKLPPYYEGLKNGVEYKYETFKKDILLSDFHNKTVDEAEYVFYVQMFGKGNVYLDGFQFPVTIKKAKIVDPVFSNCQLTLNATLSYDIKYDIAPDYPSVTPPSKLVLTASGITWNGNSFLYDLKTAAVLIHLEGQLLADKSKISQMKMSYASYADLGPVASTGKKPERKEEKEVILANVPLRAGDSSGLDYYFKGSGASAYVSKAHYYFYEYKATATTLSPTRETEFILKNVTYNTNSEVHVWFY